MVLGFSAPDLSGAEKPSKHQVFKAFGLENLMNAFSRRTMGSLPWTATK